MNKHMNEWLTLCSAIPCSEWNKTVKSTLTLVRVKGHGKLQSVRDIRMGCTKLFKNSLGANRKLNTRSVQSLSHV